MPGKNVQACLASLGLKQNALTKCGSLIDEWAVIKKSYFKAVLKNHPDKGGNAAAFRDCRTAFEVLRELYEASAISSFATSGSFSTSEAYSNASADFEGVPTPSWEYYEAAASEEVPPYRVELAKSGRGKCHAKGKAKKCSEEFIPKGKIRIGSMGGLEELGTYGRWVQLSCWRVPSKVWRGLPNPDECDDVDSFEDALLTMNCVLLSGLDELNQKHLTALAKHCMNKENHARLIKKSSSSSSGTASKADSKAASSSVSAVGSTAIVPKGAAKPRFTMPTPGRNGATPGLLRGKTIVITGVFPEVGGGAGMNLGKDKVKAMVKSFGGRVTSAVSNKTDILVVGKDPGFSKVTKARSNPDIRLMGVDEVKDALNAGKIENAGEAAKAPMLIRSFSKGFGNNGLASKASARALAVASGTAPAAIDNKSAAAKRASAKSAAVKRATAKKAAATKKASVKKAAAARKTSAGNKKVAVKLPLSSRAASKPSKRARRA